MSDEVRRDYPAAVTAGPEHGDRGLRDAIRWTAEKTREVGGQPYIFAPGKSNIADNELLDGFSKVRGVAVGTWKSRGAWSGGVVLAAWPSRDKLGVVTDDDRTRALVVVPWGVEEVSAWVAATNAERLGPALATPKVGVLDPVVVEGLKTLSIVVNHANHLAGSMDKRDAIAVLRMLRQGGYSLPPDGVYAWALANGWPDRGALRLRELSEKFEAGVAVRGGANAAIRADSLRRWRDAAKGSATS